MNTELYQHLYIAQDSIQPNCCSRVTGWFQSFTSIFWGTVQQPPEMVSPPRTNLAHAKDHQEKQVSLNPLFKTYLDPTTPGNCKNYRINELAERLNTAFHVRGGKGPISLILERSLFPVDPPSAGRNKVWFPVLPFISPKELPSYLQVTGPDDPKLNDLEYFNKLTPWIAELFEIPRKDATWVDKQAFKLYLRFMAKPDLAAKAVDFIIHHELTHCLKEHSEKIHNHKTLSSNRFILCLTLFFVRIFNFLAKIIENWTADSTTRKLEWEADYLALQHTQDIEGAVYLFETIMQQAKESREDPEAPWGTKFVITPSGDIVPLLFSHQLFSTRIERLKAEFEKIKSQANS